MPDIYGPKAHFHGVDLPRCKETPSKDEKPGPGRWGCALPEGHESPPADSELAQLKELPSERHAPHNWVRVG